MKNKTIMIPNLPTTGNPVIFNAEICVGCNSCVEVCRCDVLMPNPERGKPPIVLYAEECWYCGCCVMHCPKEGALKLVHPLNQRVGWKRKKTGEYYRIGMANPPPPNTRPPVGVDKWNVK